MDRQPSLASARTTLIAATLGVGIHSPAVAATDAPERPPRPHRGTRNGPRRVVHTAQKMASLGGVPVSEVAQATHDNLVRFYAL